MGTKRRLYILQAEGDQSRFVQVDGDVVEVSEGIDAFITRGNYPDNPRGFWRIVDICSGARLTDLCETKEAAVDSAKARVGQLGIDAYLRNRAECLDRFGFSPAIGENALDAMIIEGIQPSRIVASSDIDARLSVMECES